MFCRLLTLTAALYPSSESQQAGKGISGPSLTVPPTCCLWDFLLCHKPVPEPVVCQVSLVSNLQLNLLSAGETSVYHHTVHLVYFTLFPSMDVGGGPRLASLGCVSVPPGLWHWESQGTYCWELAHLLTKTSSKFFVSESVSPSQLGAGKNLSFCSESKAQRLWVPKIEKGKSLRILLNSPK